MLDTGKSGAGSVLEVKGDAEEEPRGKTEEEAKTEVEGETKGEGLETKDSEAKELSVSGATVAEPDIGMLVMGASNRVAEDEHPGPATKEVVQFMLCRFILKMTLAVGHNTTGE